MHYVDRVYGEVVIEEPVLIELIQSPPLLRLQHIDQGGYRPFWPNPHVSIGPYDHSRFAHSVGVCLLLRQYQAPLEEQIAGLLHDVSHSAFSHCVDYVLEGGSETEQSHQDSLHELFVKNSQIPEILVKNGFDVDYILNDAHFPLKERNLPDLCADRIDYSLRTAVLFGELTQSQAQELLSDITIHHTHWVFTHFDKAHQYAKLFVHLNQVYYAGLLSGAMFRSVGNCLKYALKHGYITETDLYTTDEEVLHLLRRHVSLDDQFKLLWMRMNNQVRITDNKDLYETSVFCKSRVIDPLFLDHGLCKRVSEYFPEWKEVLRQEMLPKQYFLSFER